MKTKKQTQLKNKKMNPIKLIGVGIGVIVLTLVSFAVADFAQVKGNQVGVLETWSDGVIDKVYPSGTHVLVPGFSKKMYTYDMNVQEYNLNEYRIQAADNQDVTITSVLRWRRDPSKIIDHHKNVRDNPEKRIIEPTMIRHIKDNVTMMKAIDGYSGEGLVTLQKNIEQSLLTDADLKNYGIIVEMFAIKDTDLKKEYITEIENRQLAIQRQSRAIEEQKAADADALVAKAKAQADFNKTLVEAQRDKEKLVLQAEALNEQSILAAKAEQQKLILESEGKKQAAIAEAEGILALGKAKAESQKLQLQAYAVEGADAFVKVEVAKSLAEAFGNIKGYLPSDMKVNLLTDNFTKAVDAISGNPVVTAK